MPLFPNHAFRRELGEQDSYQLSALLNRKMTCRLGQVNHEQLVQLMRTLELETISSSLNPYCIFVYRHLAEVLSPSSKVPSSTIPSCPLPPHPRHNLHSPSNPPSKTEASSSTRFTVHGLTARLPKIKWWGTPKSTTGQQSTSQQ
jgi:hypothetical protein